MSATVTSGDAGGTGAIVNSFSLWGQVGGSGQLLVKSTSIAAVPATPSPGIVVASQNAYWDFMQTNVIRGQTSLGRGGGSTTYAPCGWYVGYFYEAPGAGKTAAFDTLNSAIEDSSAVTINFWTDNSVVRAASAFLVAALAGVLF